MKPPVLILHVPGTNRDHAAARAVALAGGDPTIVHAATLVAAPDLLAAARMLVLPGGFSYGDDLGAGRVLAALLTTRLAEPLDRFIAAGRPVLGICNGFQALVRAGLLPGLGGAAPVATLTHNRSGRFECRWVELEPEPSSACVFTRDLAEPVFCPVAHGEGRLVTDGEATLDALEARGLVALRYAPTAGADAGYPGDPNGSARHIAGLTNPAGTILGLMPHPEDHVVAAQHPRHHRGERGRSGLPLFAAGVRYAAAL